MKTLVTGHGEDAQAVNAARRSVPYRRVVVFTTKPASKDLKALRESESLAGNAVEIREAKDFLNAWSDARLFLSAEREAVVHVSGGSNLLASALLLAALQTGREAFSCHARGVTVFPPGLTVTIDDALAPDERALLAKLPGGVADVTRMTSAEKTALLALRRRGLVEADARAARLTPVGRSWRTHL